MFAASSTQSPLFLPLSLRPRTTRRNLASDDRCICGIDRRARHGKTCVGYLIDLGARWIIRTDPASTRSRSRPGVERTLRLPAHFQREIGKTVSIRLADTVAERARDSKCVLIAADETTATVGDGQGVRAVDRVVDSTRSTVLKHRVRLGSPAEAGWQRKGQRKKASTKTKSKAEQMQKKSAEGATDTSASRRRRGRRAVVSNLDMSEAISACSREEKGYVGGRPRQGLVDALASAYKRRPGRRRRSRRRGQPDHDGFHLHGLRRRRGRQLGQRARRHPEAEELGRIAAKTFRQVMSQRIREGRTATASSRSTRTARATSSRASSSRPTPAYTLLDLGRVEALLPQAEQVPYERPRRATAEGLHRRGSQDRQGSADRRRHAPTPVSIKRLFELEVPEIADGIVEIKACARDARPPHQDRRVVERPQRRSGRCLRRSPWLRVFAWSSTSCVARRSTSSRSARTSADFVAKALSPAKVNQVEASPPTAPQADVIVPDHQLSLAIGREGQNARLSARLDGRPRRHPVRNSGRRGRRRRPLRRHRLRRGRVGENAESGEMEWHAADGSVLSQSEWVEQTEAGSRPSGRGSKRRGRGGLKHE